MGHQNRNDTCLLQSHFNLYIPLDKVEENFKRANKKDAILNEKFYFRTNIFDDGPPIIEELTLD